MLWHGTLLPRIYSVAKGHILEIAPGYGRCTQYLIPLATQLTVVDLTEKCIEYCKQRFQGHPIRYHVNDGRSLEFLADDSIDFVFSWDSLVHADEDVMTNYLYQLCKKCVLGDTVLFIIPIWVV